MDRAVPAIAALILLALALAGCATAPRAHLHTGASALPAAWTRMHIAGTSVAMHHRDGGTILASVACDAVDEDAPLDVLVNHLLLQVEKPREESRTPITLDGRGGLRTRLEVRIDGVPVTLDLVVYKKDGCVIDAQLAADARVIAARRPDFERFFAGLSIERGAR